ncbi:MAG: DUF4268 domain-containing protein, partial [candidate division WOR-3 bacterium]
HAIEAMQERIQAYSSDSTHFRGIDLFKKVGNWVWALREFEENGLMSNNKIKEDPVTKKYHSSERKRDRMSTWVGDIVLALTNLGGKATEAEICEEVSRIRSGNLPKSWRHIINHVLGDYSSDSNFFKGKDLFHKIGTGIWELRDQPVNTQPKNPITHRVVPISPPYQSPESFEEIANLLRTIKQYRDYEHPDSASWKEYVDEVFHVLGFSTEEKNQRLSVLYDMGANHTPRALVCFSRPGENFEEMVPGVSWESYLFFAAQHFKIRWGILTNGLALKVFEIQEKEVVLREHWQNLDGIICEEKLDTFCEIHKMLSYIKKDIDESPAGKSKQKVKKGTILEDDPERYQLRLEFWQSLLQKSRRKTRLHAKVQPGKDHWLGTGAGKSGMGLFYIIHMHDARVELYINRRDTEWNKQVYNYLYQHRAAIEDRFGDPINWELLPNKQASRISYVIPDYGLKDQDHWDELQDKMIDAMIRFENALRPYIQQLG